MWHIYEIIHILADSNILQLSETDQTMTTMCQVTMTWKDSFLTWEDTVYENQVHNLQLMQDFIWTPDITIQNIVETNFHLGYVAGL